MAALLTTLGVVAFVLVVLTRGIAEPGVADELIADVARIVHQHVRPATASPT